MKRSFKPTKTSEDIDATTPPPAKKPRTTEESLDSVQTPAEEASTSGGQTLDDWAMTPELASAMGLAPQQSEGAATPSGRHEVTDFGEYWVVPDSTIRSVHDAQGEQITETAFAAVKAVWDKVKDGSSRVKITEADSTGKAHAGFKASITAKIGLLMTKPNGRQLLTELMSGGFDVTIRPSAAKVYGGGQAIRGGSGTLENSDGSAGTGGTTIIEIDPAVSDSDIKVYNAAGTEISDPVYIFLGHEMIHARHNQLGRNRRNLAATNAAKYSNREEEQTIATGSGVTENQLRAEHGLDARVGTSGVDKRP